MSEKRRGRPFSRDPKFGLTIRLGLDLRERLGTGAAEAGLKPTTWVRAALERAVEQAEREDEGR